MSAIEPFSRPVYVTRPLLPDLAEYSSLLGEVWDSLQLTNNGRMAKKLETELCTFLKAGHLSLFSNGTTALQIACRVLRLHGEVITTPFTFAATSHALYWNNLKPVFCDIDEETFTMDPDKIEDLITPETSAILPVHVFGNPCGVDRIEEIAERRNLKVIYDAAHAFGVEINSKPIGTYGDISMFSFHATKVFHTIEGGALVFGSEGLKKRADELRNFGIISEERIDEPGINGKLNEVQASMGLLLLKIVREDIEKRKAVTYLYRELLKDIPGISFGKDMEGVVHNYPYFVIRIDAGEYGLSRDELHNRLREYNVFTRKYFYPLCSRFKCYSNLPTAAPGRLPAAEKIAGQVLSLPLYGSLCSDDVVRIGEMIRTIRECG